jgi:predicted transcriptional regulator
VITITELFKRLAISTTAVEKQIQKLKKQGIIERSRGTRRKGKWLVKRN